MSARELVDIYVQFFEKRGHKRIENSSLVPKDDPTTLFTSSGMQSIIKYLLGEPHPQGKRLVNVQNCFRASDIDDIGDNRHTTFFRMLGNWSLGDYFKAEQIPWFWEFLVNELKLDPKRLYVSVFEGYKNIKRDEESADIWKELFEKAGIDSSNRVFYCGVDDNWWSRSGTPDEMPEGEPGGPDSEVYFDLKPDDERIIPDNLRKYTGSRRLLEIGNSVFMTYQKKGNSFIELKQKNVDYGGGLERQLAAVENKEDIFQTSLFKPIVDAVEQSSNKKYNEHQKEMRIVADHFRSASFIIADGVSPSNKQQGYILRRLIRRGFDALNKLGTHETADIVKSIVDSHKDTDPNLVKKFEEIKLTIESEGQSYKKVQEAAISFIEKEVGKRIGDELKGVVEIPASVAFMGTATYGLSPSQLKSLGYTFNEQEYADLTEEHQKKSRESQKKKFNG